MDGHFRSEFLRLGPPVVALLGCAKTISKVPFDCHLMIENPDDFIAAFAGSGRQLDFGAPGKALHTPEIAPCNLIANARMRACRGYQSRHARANGWMKS